MQFPIQQKFKLSESFLEKYKNEKPNFGFNGLGEFVFLRTYSRVKEDGKNEMWWEVVKRIVEGVYNIQRTHIEEFNLGWNNAKAQRSAQEMFARIFYFKMLPAGRGIWAMGTPVVMERGLTAALFNCSYVSTDNIQENPGKVFSMAMDFLMCGIGVGADTLGDGKVRVRGTNNKTIVQVISDDREGWVNSIEDLINHYVYGKEQIEFDYSLIRKEGELIKGFGGVASGPAPLKDLHLKLESILINRIGDCLTGRDITDIFNLIGKAVVAGNVRRSAEIILGEPTEDFLDLKNYTKNPDRAGHGWASNNSIYAKLGMDYKDIASRISANGEPGIYWLDNARRYGRIKETDAGNKDSRVQGLNPCVIGETEILTDYGYEQIQNLVDIPVNIWNGFEWSKVTPKVTGENQDVLTINFSDGRSLTCTPYHRFHIADGYTGRHSVVEAKDLQPGMKLEKHNFPILHFKKELENAYTNGFVAADGMELDRTLYVYKPKECCLSRIEGKRLIRKEESNNRIRVTLDFIPTSKSFVPFDYSVNSKLEWLAGLFDGDGTELKEGGVQIASVNREFLLDVQKLLSTLRVQSKVLFGKECGEKMLPNHRGGYSSYFCNTVWRICIGATQIQDLVSLGLHCERLKFCKTPQRDASQFVQVVDVTEAGIADKVYCFTEEKNHTGIFNGVFTSNCGEATLEPWEFCNLAELIPENHESLEDFHITIKYAYLYAKTITLLSTPWPEVNRTMLRNRRIGLSMTGIAQFISNRGLKVLGDWMEEGYKTVDYYDKVYSDWFAVPSSIKYTTIKPSGTISLLAGATPGIHFPESNYYIRRVRLAKNSPFVSILEDSGYAVEPAVGQEDSTVVVEFPVSIGENVRTLKDVSMWEQLELAAFAQEHWADNSVSVTVTFDPEKEGKDIEHALNLYQFRLKAVSFLPKLKQGAYAQMPYEEISKEKYEEMVSDLLPLNFTNLFSEEALGEKYCSNDGCVV
jgi:ribonucleotide reductase alpha subunit